MIRRVFLQRLALSAVAVGLAVAGAHADPVADITDEIRSQGFKIVRVQRTWLGRVRIIGQNDSFRREVVIDPTTGEIRRDLLVPRPGGSKPPAEPSDASRGATRGLDKLEDDDAAGDDAAEDDAVDPDEGTWGGGWGPSDEPADGEPDAR